MQRQLFNIGVYLTALVVLVDQMSKWWAMDVVKTALAPLRITSYFNVTLSMNKGVTFGMLSKSTEWMPWVLVAVALIILLFLLHWLRRAVSRKEALGLGLIIGGAVGNLIDRLRFGAVVDFLDFHYAGYHWYTFNVADSAIVAGVALLMLDHYLIARRAR